MKSTNGLIQLYCGDGKGKTTAAIGLLIRALGRGRRCVLVQFLKGNETGELEILQKQSNLQIFRGDPSMPFTFCMNEEQKEKTRKLHARQLQMVSDLLKTGQIDLVVLDEVCAACSSGLMDLVQIETLIREKPENVELVLTGRNPQPFMLEEADYISEIHSRRHPFEQGIPAREGIEY